MSLWKIKPLIVCHLLAFLLVLSMFWSPSYAYWYKLDLAAFKALNAMVKESSFWQHFWAMMNHRWADWVEDIFIAAFFMVYITSAPKGFQRQRLAQFLFSVCYAGLVIFGVKYLCRTMIHIYRDSPSLIVEGAVRLSEQIPWMRIKDSSNDSFPGNHGLTAIFFAFFYSYFARWPWGFIGALYAAFVCLPRMVTGAHWLSDLIAGSGAICLVCCSWAVCTPLLNTLTKGRHREKTTLLNRS